MHEEAAQRGAALAGGAHGAEGDGAQRHVEVGGRADDAGVVAAEFEDGAGETLGQARTDVAAHAGGAGRRNERNLRMIDKHFADSAVADQNLGKAFRRVAEAGQRALKDSLRGKRRERGLFGRLPDDGVAADDRQRRVPRPYGDREVEGGDDADDAERMPGFHHAVARTFGGDRQAVELTGETDREIADVDHFLHFAETFGRDLAGFDGDEAAEIGLMGAQFLAEQADQFAALRGGNQAPGAECCVGLFDLGGGFGGGIRLEAADLLAGNRAERGHVATGVERLLDAELFEKCCGFLSHVHFCCNIHGLTP